MTNNDLEHTTATAVQPVLPDSDRWFDHWVETGQQLAKHHATMHWEIGDWLLHGAAHWTDRWMHVTASLDIPDATLAQCAAVAAKFDPDTRRPELSWTHHRTVLRLPDEQANRWLGTAATEGWSTRELARRVDMQRQLEAGHPELDGMPPAPKWDRTAAAKYMADGITRVIVDLTTGVMEPAS